MMTGKGSFRKAIPWGTSPGMLMTTGTTKSKKSAWDRAPRFYEYDASNRLVRKKEKWENGDEFIFTYAYDTFNQLISDTDRYGN